MSVAKPINLEAPSFESGAGEGVRLHRFTVPEYHRMRDAGVFEGDNPIELLEGYLFIKMDYGPPYDVPLGIPPEVIAGPDVPPFPQRKFTVREYDRLMESGALHPTLRTELVEGWVIDKMVRGFKHDSSLQRTADALQRRLSAQWIVRQQSAVVMDHAETEPDIVVVPGPIGGFDFAHPRPSHVALLIEISESTLAYDRGPKMRDYARNGIVRYWVVNLIDRVLEVFDGPSGPTEAPQYHSHRIYRAGETIPLAAGNQEFEPLLLEELLPRE